MASNHDIVIVNTVAYAIDLSSQTKGELGEIKFKASAIAAIDTLIGLGWRPPLTNAEHAEIGQAVSTGDQWTESGIHVEVDTEQGWIDWNREQEEEFIARGWRPPLTEQEQYKMWQLVEFADKQDFDDDFIESLDYLRAMLTGGRADG